MKAIRKSLNKDSAHAAQISPPLPPISKPTAALVPPQKVIRASGAYRSTAPTELSFQKGDFFYVVREINNGAGEWYEAHNPVSGARGVVPRRLFEEFNKGAAPNGYVPLSVPIPISVWSRARWRNIDKDGSDLCCGIEGGVLEPRRGYYLEWRSRCGGRCRRWNI